ncbi:MAG: hypothetical protein GKR87_07740 [Kiritimatiellae bacterium]|nr:hypothetical protein [Kiritimatiellia bacterium]
MPKRKKQKQNRKKQEGGFAFPAPLASILLLAAILSLSYLWVHGRCEALGVYIQDLEAQKEKIYNQFLNEEYKWSNMKTLPNIKAALLRNGSVMSWPNEDQIVRVFSSREEDSISAKNQYAQYSGSVMND